MSANNENFFESKQVGDNVLKRLKNQRTVVIIVGEGNYTFTAAFAAIRGGIDNIFASDFDNRNDVPKDDECNANKNLVQQTVGQSDATDAPSMEHPSKPSTSKEGLLNSDTVNEMK